MPCPAVAFVFSKVGPVEDCRGAQAIEMPVVLWHEARCAGAEDFEVAAEDFAEGAGATFEVVA